MALRLFHRMIRHIGPTYALQEVIYGLVMALGTISTVAIAIGLSSNARDTLILAAIGVNTTWGLADMIMYMVTKNFDRMRHQKMADAIRSDDDGEFSVEAIEDDLSETIVATLDPVDQRRIYLDVLDSEARAMGRPTRFSAGHFYGGLTCLILTMLAAVPLILPLLFIEPLSLGLRVASLTAMALLFFTGYYWAPYAGLRKWRTGLGTMGAGAVITLATLVIGG